MEYFVLADFYKIKAFLLGELSAKVPKDDNHFSRLLSNDSDFSNYLTSCLN